MRINFEKLNYVIIIIINLVILHNINARETTKAGTAAAQFLKIGVGARAQAMAGAFVAATGDVASLYWNPAGAATISQKSWSGTYTNWLADLTHQFTGLIIPVRSNSVVGISATFLNMGAEEITTLEKPAGTGLFWDASDFAVGISYAKQLTDFFSIGITGKYIHQRIYHETASTLALDVGTCLRTPFHGLRIGMCFSNFGGDLQLDGRDLMRGYDLNPANSRNDAVDARLGTPPWPLPINFRVGIALELMGNHPENFWQARHHQLLLLADANHPNDAAENVCAGLEYLAFQKMALRGGYQFNSDLLSFTFGGGLKIPLRTSILTIDYALANFGEFNYINYFSFSLVF
jgi:hypothetical protein